MRSANPVGTATGVVVVVADTMVSRVVGRVTVASK
jgi:hypothetical protein